MVRTDGVLIPFARRGDDGWDLPWPAPFDAETAPLDTDGEAGPPGPGREPTLPTPPIDRQDPRGGRIAAPMQWSFYSQTERGTALAVARLLLIEVQCLMSWALGFGDRELSSVEGTRGVAGVAFNHPLEIVSSSDGIPALDQMSAELGLVDATDVDDPTQSRRFVWLGFYRLDDGGVIGVVNDLAFEGESWLVVEIDGEQGRIVHRVLGGGC